MSGTITLSATPSHQIKANLQNQIPSPSPLMATGSIPLSVTVQPALASPAFLYFNETTIAGTTQTIVLNNGSITDGFGNALTYANVLDFLLENTSMTQTIVVGGGSNPALGSDQFTVKAGGCVHITSTHVIDGTHFNLLLTTTAGATYQLVIVGS